MSEAASDDLALAGPAAFDRCLAVRPVVRSGPFALHLFRSLPAPDAAEPCWRLGLVIPKRYEASAVARNTIKRRWRAAFRRGRASWAIEFGSADLVVRMQAPLVPKAEAANEPARVRARDRFDPLVAFGSLADRLRERGRAGSKAAREVALR